MSVCAHRPEPAGSFVDCSRVGGCVCRDEVQEMVTSEEDEA